MEKIKKLFISLLRWFRIVEEEPDLRALREEFVKKLRRLVGKGKD
jgi:hypothetical protein